MISRPILIFLFLFFLALPRTEPHQFDAPHPTPNTNLTVNFTFGNKDLMETHKRFRKEHGIPDLPSFLNSHSSSNSHDDYHRKSEDNKKNMHHQLKHFLKTHHLLVIIVLVIIKILIIGIIIYITVKCCIRCNRKRRECIEKKQVRRAQAQGINSSQNFSEGSVNSALSRGPQPPPQMPYNFYPINANQMPLYYGVPINPNEQQQQHYYPQQIPHAIYPQAQYPPFNPNMMGFMPPPPPPPPPMNPPMNFNGNFQSYPNQQMMFSQREEVGNNNMNYPKI